MPANPAIYLDSFAGAPLHPIVGEALFSFLKAGGGAFANPSSSHAHGRKARSILDQSRLSILKSLELDPKEFSVLFCSSGSEAVQQATRTMWSVGKIHGKKLWALSAGEHSSVREMLRECPKEGMEARILPLKSSGEVSFDISDDEVSKIAGLSLLPASNETGALTSHIQCGLLTSKQRPLLLLDWIAAWGKIGAPREWNFDYLAITGHKIGAPSGAAALIHRKSAPLLPIFPGNAQNGLRAGTENVLSAFCLGVLADALPKIKEEQNGRIASLRDRLEQELKKLPIPVVINGEGCKRLPGVTNFTWAGADKKLSLVTQFDLEGICVSSGSACSSKLERPSPVLLAMGKSEMDASNSIRVSFSWESKETDVDAFISAFHRVIERLKPTLKTGVKK